MKPHLYVVAPMRIRFRAIELAAEDLVMVMQAATYLLADFRKQTISEKASSLLLLAVIVSMMVGAAQWVLSPPSAERVKQQALAECRGLEQALLEVAPKAASQESLVEGCLFNKLRRGSAN